VIIEILIFYLMVSFSLFIFNMENYNKTKVK
jgi:hypothetical protein